jgi:hypothetical protein
MVPFGYHLVEHGPEVRTVLGQLYAVGLVYYLSLLPASRFRLQWREDGAWPYALWTVAAIGLLQAAIHWGGSLTSTVLAWCGFAGFVVLGALAVANVILLPRAVRQALTRPRLSAVS